MGTATSFGSKADSTESSSLDEFLWETSKPRKEYLEVFFLITVKKSGHYGTEKKLIVDAVYFLVSEMSEYIAFTFTQQREQKHALLHL